jgi:hypothetical protein
MDLYSLISKNLDLKVLGDDNINSHTDDIHHLFSKEGTQAMYERVGLVLKYVNQSSRDAENWYKQFEDGKHTFLGCIPKLRYGILVPTHESNKLMASLFHTPVDISPNICVQRFAGLLLLAVHNVEDYPYVRDYILSLRKAWLDGEDADFLDMMLSRDRLWVEKLLLGLEDKENNGEGIEIIEKESEESCEAWRRQSTRILEQKDTECCLRDCGF